MEFFVIAALLMALKKDYACVLSIVHRNEREKFKWKIYRWCNTIAAIVK